MISIPRVALPAASFLCAVAVFGASAPSFATEIAATGIPGGGSATAMLAAVTAPLLSVDVRALQSATTDIYTAGADAPAGTTLAGLVERNAGAETASDEDRCLATSVYFESKGEPLDGQLAVAQTILNRTSSGRFADSVCGVVRQPGQFSFVHGSAMPDAPHNDAWSRAVAVAKIARAGLWKQIAPAALYFHARRVAPGWGKVQVAAIGNHIFFR